jgi:hypothetical protein
MQGLSHDYLVAVPLVEDARSSYNRPITPRHNQINILVYSFQLLLEAILVKIQIDIKSVE